MCGDLDLAAEPTGAFVPFEEAMHYLEQVCARQEINHLAYSLVHSIDGTPDQISWIATYDPAYMSYYMEHYSHLGDPSVDTAFANNGIVDWAEWLSSDSMWRELFPTATRYGITKFGVSFPLKDGDFGNVLFSINVKSNDRDWIGVECGINCFRSFVPLLSIFTGASSRSSSCARLLKSSSRPNRCRA